MGSLGRSTGKVCLAYGVGAAMFIQAAMCSPASGAEIGTQRQGPSIEARFGSVEINALRRSLDPETLLLTYSLDSERLWMTALDRDHGLLQDASVAMGEADLEVKVDQLLSLITAARHEGNQFFDAFLVSSTDLYTTLLLPFESLLEGKERLVVVPDGPLHRLPFETLVRPRSEGHRDWQYVIQWKPLHKVPSVASYLRWAGEGVAEIDAAATMVAIGDADYGFDRGSGDDRRRPGATRGRGTLRSIPETGREVRTAAGGFPNHRIFVGKDATKDKLVSLPRDIDILHLSVHGQVDEADPDRTALIFSPIRLGGRPIPGSERLEMSEILEGEVPPARLVVLSACSSAVGPAREGEGMLGLGWAFLAAGARSVVSSLWPVDDGRTADLMTDFYGHLTGGSAPGEALRRAQLNLIEDPSGATLAPYYWAAFQVQGDWR